MYIATEYFEDAKDGRRRYFPGDKYPADGVTVSEARLAELSSNRNARRRPVIAAVAVAAESQTEETTEKPKAKRGRKKATKCS